MSQNPFASPQEISEPATPTVFYDRTVGLVLFGVLEILIGLVVAMLLAFTTAMLVSGPAVPAWAMIPALAIYGLLAVGLVWLGIGSIQARRWARAITLAIAWLWLIFGTMGVAFYAVGVLPAMYTQLSRDGSMPPGALLFILAFSIGVTAALYMLLPAVIVAFYQSKHVQATCERKDPKTRWTDHCPQSVLTLSLILAFASYCSFWSGVAGGIVYFFGTFLRGFSAAAVSLGFALVCLCLAWGLYRLRMVAWWSSLLLSLLFCVSAVISSLSGRWTEMYQAMGMTEAQIRSTQKFAGNMQSLSGWGGVAAAVVLLGYLLAIRRHFVAAASARKPVETPQAPIA